MDMLTFYLVEEAIKRNRCTVQMQEDLSLMIWERVRIELIYIKNLQEWSDTADKEATKQELEMSEFDRQTLECIAKEGQETAALHQNVYNALMSDDGPYINLKNNTGLKQPIILSSKGRGLQDIEDEFIKYNKRRVYLITDKHKRKQAIESMKAAVTTLEGQMSNRSRVTVARRSGQRGHRKVDAMMNRLSLLRKHIESETSALNQTERDLEEFVKEKNRVLHGMLIDLEELEKQRMLQIHREMKSFTDRLGTLDDPTKRGRRREYISRIVLRIDSENIGHLIDEQWRAVERKAKARKAGLVYCLEDFLAPTKASYKKKKERVHESTRSHATLSSADEPSYNNKVLTVRSVIDRVGDTTVVSYSSGGHTLMSTFYNSSDESLGIGGTTNPTKKPSESSGSSSGSRIETIFIPVDKGNVNRLPPPFPTREFCPGTTDDEDGFSSASGSGSSDMQFAFDPHNVRLVPKSDQDYSANVDVSLMRNVRVIADHEYTARKKGEISFKKGQIIKQKAGENEDGFSYGWTRETKIAPKHYGWYPSGLVSFYHQETQS